MVNDKIEYKLPPEDFFFTAGVDRSLCLLQTPEWLWRPQAPARISGFALSKFAQINTTITAKIEMTKGARKFTRPIEFNTVPAVLENAQFVKWAVNLGGRWLLNGAAGTRLRNRYAWRNKDEGERQTVAHFAALSGENSPVHLPERAPMPPLSVPVALELRNGFNFYHFVSETLPMLAVLEPVAHGRDVYLHYDGTPPRPFMRAFIEALFPDLAARVKFVETPARYDRVISCYNFEHFYFQSPEHVMASFNEHAPKSWAWTDRRADGAVLGTLNMNAMDVGLRLLREKARQAIEGHDFSYLPRRFWVSRENGDARSRQMKNEEAMIAALRPFGFEVVHFEHLSPLEQIAIMANADIMASYHGAGFANMLWAGPQARIIEIGTLQTATIRWGMFLPLAHASGCQYICAFADHNTRTPQRAPDYDADGLVPVAIYPPAIAALGLFVAALSGALPQDLGRRDLEQLSRMLLEAEEFAALKSLLEGQKPGKLKASPDLLRAMVRACDEEDDPEGAFVALKLLWACDKTSHGPVERLAWLSRRFELQSDLHRYLSDYEAHFPDRFTAFVGRAPWFGKVHRGEVSL
ncbi:glycosyltransferase family 61 protein [Rhodobacteraceae bacterium]|nr:glycosyltransferase family 61 protein [Paracoccaceae bacterium]